MLVKLSNRCVVILNRNIFSGSESYYMTQVELLEIATTCQNPSILVLVSKVILELN